MSTMVVKGDTQDLSLVKIFRGTGEDGTGPGKKWVQISLEKNYGGQNLGVLNRLFDVACQDFPEAGLTPDSVNAVALGGPSRKHMWGIEFKVPADTKMPEGYRLRSSEPILAGGF